MKWYLVFILLIPLSSRADALLDYIYGFKSEPERTEEVVEARSNDEAEHYSWELGEPDNAVKTEVIIESGNPCSQDN